MVYMGSKMFEGLTEWAVWILGILGASFYIYGFDLWVKKGIGYPTILAMFCWFVAALISPLVFVNNELAPAYTIMMWVFGVLALIATITMIVQIIFNPISHKWASGR
jgi:hypothetical protein